MDKRKYGEFAVATAERAIKTFAQAAVAMLTGGAMGIVDVDWLNVLSVSALAAVVSVLTSIASAPAGGDGPSLTSAEVLK